MAKKPSVTIVGMGRLGLPLAEALVKSGYVLKELVLRDEKSLRKRAKNLPRSLRSRAVTWEQARFDADIICLCVPDGQIEQTAARLQLLAEWKGKVVLHSSGALTSDALQVLRAKGASVASVHPLMTFVHGSKPPLASVPFGLEGDGTALKVAGKIINALRGEAFLVRKQDKVLYHAWGTLLSPLLLSYVTTAEQIARSIGIPAQSARKKMLPILLRTLANYSTRGPANSFSGPFARGDAAIVASHLRALEKVPQAREAYIALARSALDALPVGNRRRLEKLLREA